MAPVAAGIADAEKHRLVLVRCFFEYLTAPGAPVHRIVLVLKEIGGFFVLQQIHSIVCLRQKSKTYPYHYNRFHRFCEDFLFTSEKKSAMLFVGVSAGKRCSIICRHYVTALPAVPALFRFLQFGETKPGDSLQNLPALLPFRYDHFPFNILPIVFAASFWACVVTWA